MAPFDKSVFKNSDAKRWGIEHYDLGVKVTTFKATIKALEVQRKSANLGALIHKQMYRDVITKCNDSMSFTTEELPKFDLFNHALDNHIQYLLEDSHDTIQQLLQLVKDN